MADESKIQVLERKIAVARRELNNLRRDVNSMKKMFVQKFKEVEELVEKGKQESTPVYKQDSCKMDASGMNPQGQVIQEHGTFHSEMKPISFVESCFKEKNGIPRQPSVCPVAKAKLCVNVEGFTNPAHSLDGLEKFSHVWIIFVFHKNTNKAIKAKVKPPRLDGAKVGVFASRSPHRPNPIGLTLAKLDSIIGNTLLLSGIDLLDGTPVLDIKPYVPGYDKPLCFNGKDKLEFESSNITLSPTMDNSKSQESFDQPSLNSVDAPVDQSSTTQENLELKAESTSIAEWIRKPPIKELNVKFSAEAAAQISCFHGNMLLREHCHHSECDRNVDGVSFQRCTCVQNPEVLSERFACKEVNGEGTDHQSTVCLQEEITGGRFNKDGHQSTQTDYSDGNKVELRLSYSKVSLDAKHNEALKDAKCNGSQEEFTVPLSKRCPPVGENDSDSLKAELCEASAPSSHFEVHQSSSTCIYQLKMLSSSEEAEKAITDILKADPRSVYRRNRCQDQLYRFSIDTMNVTCKFEDTTVKVLRVEPVYYRKLNRNSKETRF